MLPLPKGTYRDSAELISQTAQWMTIDQTTTAVEWHGREADRVVVLVHGFGGATTNWQATWPALVEAGYQVVAIDLKGFGLATKQFEDSYTHASQAQFIAAVMSELKIERAILVGHSMGGSVIAHFAELFPERTEQLVFVDGGAFQVEGQRRYGRGFGRMLAFPPVRQWGRQILLRSLSQELVYRRFQTAFADGNRLSPELFAQNMRGLEMKDWELALLGIFRDGSSNQLNRPIDSEKIRSVVIWGAQDRWISLRTGRWFADQLPAPLYIVPDAGHLPMMEQPEAFNQQLLELLLTP